MKRIAFDLDETLGVPLIDELGVLGWQLRQGCAELLDRLQPDFALLLWSASSRVYVDKALNSGLSWFADPGICERGLIVTQEPNAISRTPGIFQAVDRWSAACG